MREEAKQEFLSKSNAMIGVESFKSVWFEKMTTQLYQVLHEMGERGLEIDLNEAVIEDGKVVAAVEDEGRRDTAIKRKRRGGSQHSSGTKLAPSTALRIHESKAPASRSALGMANPNNVHPFDQKHKNKVTPYISKISPQAHYRAFSQSSSAFFHHRATATRNEIICRVSNSTKGPLYLQQSKAQHELIDLWGEKG